MPWLINPPVEFAVIPAVKKLAYRTEVVAPADSMVGKSIGLFALGCLFEVNP